MIKGYSTNSAIDILIIEADILIKKEIENYATFDPLYDKNKLLVLMMYKRKLFNKKSSQIINQFAHNSR